MRSTKALAANPPKMTECTAPMPRAGQKGDGQPPGHAHVDRDPITFRTPRPFRTLANSAPEVKLAVGQSAGLPGSLSHRSPPCLTVAQGVTIDAVVAEIDSLPPTNHLAEGGFHSSTLVQGANQCSSSRSPPRTLWSSIGGDTVSRILEALHVALRRKFGGRWKNPVLMQGGTQVRLLMCRFPGSRYPSSILLTPRFFPEWLDWRLFCSDADAIPGAAHDVVELVEFGLPTGSVPIFAELAIRTAGSPGRRGSSRSGIGMPRSLAGPMSTTFPHRKTMAIAKVVDHPVAFIERVERQEMCFLRGPARGCSPATASTHRGWDSPGQKS